jgi:betaine reductase
MSNSDRTDSSVLKGRKVVVFGERDDVSGHAIRNCVTAAGGEVVYETTSCFV